MWKCFDVERCEKDHMPYMVTRYSLVYARAAAEDIKHVHDILEH